MFLSAEFLQFFSTVFPLLYVYSFVLAVVVFFKNFNTIYIFFSSKIKEKHIKRQTFSSFQTIIKIKSFQSFKYFSSTKLRLFLLFYKTKKFFSRYNNLYIILCLIPGVNTAVFAQVLPRK